eukprot:CAMPEP_0170416202 /NCGR_PEP_ID=MMETSP0117_2-20130122/33028_1 /TAXON_ID=400756 /ORGANISM="Durinskia baltica, Strain CSIRO CS-38" /LENGTH=37 /DNA_ID= /DNA_START= /DNA_END= /DNA_ORIENTATION=
MRPSCAGSEVRILYSMAMRMARKEPGKIGQAALDTST